MPPTLICAGVMATLETVNDQAGPAFVALKPTASTRQ
jgi:hypothetical protein